jgi:hypothetical protein
MPSPTFETAWAQKQAQFKHLLGEMAELVQAEFGDTVPPELAAQGTLELKAQVNAVDADGNDMTTAAPYRLVLALLNERRDVQNLIDDEGKQTLVPGPTIVGLIGIEA